MCWSNSPPSLVISLSGNFVSTRQRLTNEKTRQPRGHPATIKTLFIFDSDNFILIKSNYTDFTLFVCEIFGSGESLIKSWPGVLQRQIARFPVVNLRNSKLHVRFAPWTGRFFTTTSSYQIQSKVPGNISISSVWAASGMRAVRTRPIAANSELFTRFSLPSCA